RSVHTLDIHSFPTRRSSDLRLTLQGQLVCYGRAVAELEWPAMRHERSSPVVQGWINALDRDLRAVRIAGDKPTTALSHWFDQSRSEEHTSELQSPYDLVCRL